MPREVIWDYIKRNGKLIEQLADNNKILLLEHSILDWLLTLSLCYKFESHYRAPLVTIYVWRANSDEYIGTK